MPFPYDGDTEDAIERADTYYNGNDYDASTNPGGFAQGGHRINFIPALQDVATIASSISAAATFAETQADAAAASAVDAAASATSLQGTSATSVAIGTGSKSFTTQTDKAFNVGVWLNIRSGANPTLNYMIGQVTAYNSGTGALTVNVTQTSGSGTFADWTIDVSAPPGQTGSTGATGALGPSPAIQWNFSTGTTDSDPGNGLFKFNSATTTAITFVYLDNTNKDSTTVTNWLDSLDDSTNTADRGRLFFVQPSDATKFVSLKVTGAVVDGTGYRKVPVSYLSSSSPSSVPFADAVAVAVDFSPTGNKGADGAGAGDVVGPSSATDGAISLFDTSTGKLIKDSGVGISTSGANVGKLDGNNTYSGNVSFTGTFAWSSTLIGTVSNANALTVGRQGSTNPAFNVDTATASSATGIKVTAAAAAGGVAVAATSSGTNESVTIDAKGTGTITLNGTATGAVLLPSGTVSLPGIGFGADTDCGFYRIGANNIGAAVNGAKVLDISTSGLAVTGRLSVTTFIDIPEASAPANPSADTGRLYVKDSGGTTKLYFRDNAGTETDLISGGGDLLAANNLSDVANVATARNNLRAPLMEGYLYGLTLSNNGSDAANDIDIATGQAANDASTYVMATNTITKRLDAAWAVGTGNGGRDTGSIADGTWHVWLIRRSDTGVVDALFSTSPSAPTMPTNYDQKRRIGSILRESGSIVAFKQDGDTFHRVSLVTDVNTNNPGTSAITATLSVPTGIVVTAEIIPTIQNTDTANATFLLLTALDETDETPSSTLQTGMRTINLAGGNSNWGVPMQCKTNTSAQVRYRLSFSNANVTARILTRGWIDRRGRLAA